MNSLFFLLSIPRNERFTNFIECLNKVTDFRSDRKDYPLVNILMIATCAVLGGANDITAIAQFDETTLIGLVFS